MADTTILQEKETIELTKTTRGYTWSIKVKAIMLTQVDIDRLNGIDKAMRILYGEQNGN